MMYIIIHTVMHMHIHAGPSHLVRISYLTGETPPTPDFYATSPNPLTATGPGLYTHQASATASTPLCVVLPLIP